MWEKTIVAVIAGVDDAGRGPVIGPLVIAGVSIEEEENKLLSEAGVKDSKALTPRQRLILDKVIRRLAKDVSVEVISPRVVDEYASRKRRFEGLNLLEAEVMAEVVSKLNPDLAFIDASDVIEKRFGEWVGRLLPPRIRVISEHHADQRHPVVAASSIVAKVCRDREVGEMRKTYGDFGSGYASDHKTILFLREQYHAHGCYPPIVRRSWRTVKRLESEICQSKIA